MSATIIIPGNITRDAETRQAGSSHVVSFSVAVNTTVKREKVTQFFDCSWFGARALAVSQYLTKGSKVAVVGSFSTREHNGKTYLQCDVQDVTLLGGGNRDGGPRPTPASGGGEYNPDDAGPGDNSRDDDFPF
jgi:single-strand DNA-binding protein